MPGSRSLTMSPDDAVVRASAPHGMSVENLTPTIGSIIHGIDLRDEMTDDVFEFLDRTLVERKVLFFNEQDITATQHIAFARRWGELEVEPLVESDPEHPELLVLRRKNRKAPPENCWHSDGAWRELPPMGAVLRAKIVPKIGGDTIWADMSAAYDELPDWLKDAIEGRSAVNSFHRHLGLAHSQAVESGMYPPQTWPVARTHPVSGRRIIYVNPSSTSHIEGLSASDSNMILEALFKHCIKPEYQVRFKWKPNSVAFWDNRSTQHYALSDYGSALRVMERVGIRGAPPV